MSRAVLVLLLLLPELSAVSADLEVRFEKGLVTVRARAAPLAEVLDRLCVQIGVDLVYEGPRPSPLITATLEDVPESEMPGRLLEGLGLNYAYQMDATGRRVERLIVGEVFGSEPAGGTARLPSGPRGSRPPPSYAAPEEPALDDIPYESPDDDSDPPPEVSPEADVVPYAPGLFPEGLERPEVPADASSPLPPRPLVPYPIFPGDPSHPRP